MVKNAGASRVENGKRCGNRPPWYARFRAPRPGMGLGVTLLLLSTLVLLWIETEAGASPY